MKFINKGFLTLFFISLLVSCSEKQATVKPIYQPLTESVYCSVIIEPVDFYKVYATTNAVVDQIFAKEGDILKEGDTLLTLIDDPSTYRKENAALELALAKEDFEGTSNLIQDLEHDLQLAQAMNANDSINFERQKRLKEEKIGSEIEFEQRKLTFQTSQSKVKQIKNSIARRKDELKTRLMKAQNNFKTNRFQNDEYVVRSKIDGKLYELLKAKGESVNIQEPVAYLGSGHAFLIKMQVDEVDIVKLKEGQAVWVSLDAYEDEVFEAVVEQIIPKMNQETQTFWVEGIFKKAPSVLYSGLRGEANIVIKEKKSTLTIPLVYLRSDNTVETKNGIVDVEIGLKGIEIVEILSGLDTTSALIKP